MKNLKIKNKKQRYIKLQMTFLLSVSFLLVSHFSFSQKEKEIKTVPDGTDGTVHIIRPEDSVAKKLPPNEFNGSHSTFKVGLGFLPEYATYVQDDIFKKQMDSAGLEMKSKYKTRDFRVLASGVLTTKRPISWKFAFMYDGDKDQWFVRESGVTIGVKELSGNFFIGRTKEGFSMVKVMNGYAPWSAERQIALDVIPIFGDGIKYFGFFKKPRIFLNLGYYNDVLSKGMGFSTFAWQYDARVGWLPIYDKEKQKVLHVGVSYRYGKPLDNQIILKSRPESNPAPFIISTGTFSSDHSRHYSGEIYYSSGRFLLGSEVIMHKFYSDVSDDHQFVGGNVVLTYLFTDTKRPYSTTNSGFGFIPVKKPVFKGGWGEWEGVLTYSNFDLNDGSIKGGKFWRITPMINWYMTKTLRMEFIYGYGILDRYKLKGALQVYQVRLQLGVI
jgi:phosphate-selective porin OprO/OprP